MPFEQPGVKARRERMQARENAEYARSHPPAEKPLEGMEKFFDKIRKNPMYFVRKAEHDLKMKIKEELELSKRCHKCGANTGRGYSHTFDCYYRGW